MTDTSTEMALPEASMTTTAPAGGTPLPAEPPGRGQPPGAALSRAEQLAACERDMERGFAQFAAALEKIRDKRLWLYAGGCNTFEEYCRTRWGLTRQHVNRNIRAAAIGKILEPMGSKIKNERQARELAPLAGDPERLREVYRRAEAAAGGRTPTGAQIAHARDGTEPEPGDAPGTAAPRSDRDGQVQAGTARPPAPQPVTQAVPAAPAPAAAAPAEPEVAAPEPAAVVAVVSGQVITEAPPAVPAQTLRRLAVASGMSTDRAEAELATLTLADLIEEITCELESATAGPADLEPARLLRSAVALAHSTRSPRELRDMLGGMPAGELAAAAEAVSALGDRLTQASWLAGDAEARAMSSS